MSPLAGHASSVIWRVGLDSYVMFRSKPTRSFAFVFALLTLSLAACGDDDDTPLDASDDVAATCTIDEDCRDEFFCNGEESCNPDNPASNARGCFTPSTPCAEGMCLEDEDRCAEGCVDADMDGHEDARCGGDDCDDSDPDRYPGNPEICDALGVDEDCNPNTLGTDADGDGFAAEECCNLRGADLICGRDCDDDLAGIAPGQADGCGGGDEDCDGDFDEDADEVFYRDRDSDGFGVPDDTVMACSAPPGYAPQPTDCNDDLGAINPGVPEVCDGLVDENCSGEVDEGCPCSPEGGTRSCATEFAGVGLCRMGTQTCTAAGWSDECVDAVLPTPEDCDDATPQDENCDGVADEICECINATTRVCGNDRGACRSVTQTCAVGRWPTASCDDAPGVIAPSDEACEGSIDEDCDGAVDEGCTCTLGAERPCGETDGACTAGVQTCVDVRGTATWAECVGGIQPVPEMCDELGLDQDCDGITDAMDRDIPMLGDTCGSSVGTCETGIFECRGVSGLVCGGGEEPESMDVCDHEDEDCDGATDESALECGFLASNLIGDVLLRDDLECDVVSCRTGTAGVIRLGGITGGIPSSASERGYISREFDWSAYTRVRASFTISGTSQTAGVMMVPQRTGSGTTPYIGNTNPGSFGYLAHYQHNDRRGRLFELTPTGPVLRATTAALPRTCTGAQQITVRFTANTSDIEVEIRGCSDIQAASYLERGWVTKLYVANDSYPTYHVGAVGHSVGPATDNYVFLRFLSIDREPRSGSRGPCDGCP